MKEKQEEQKLVCADKKVIERVLGPRVSQPRQILSPCISLYFPGEFRNMEPKKHQFTSPPPLQCTFNRYLCVVSAEHTFTKKFMFAAHTRTCLTIHDTIYKYQLTQYSPLANPRVCGRGCRCQIRYTPPPLSHHCGPMYQWSGPVLFYHLPLGTWDTQVSIYKGYHTTGVSNCWSWIHIVTVSWVSRSIWRYPPYYRARIKWCYASNNKSDYTWSQNYHQLTGYQFQRNF